MAYKDLGPILKSPIDTTDYKAIELHSNGIRSLLISVCDHHLPIDPSLDPHTCAFEAIEDFNFRHLGIGEDPKYQYEEPKKPRIIPKKGPICHSKRGEDVALKNHFVISLVVGSGMFDDERVPGMAHFVEHCIFISSKNYREKEGLAKFLAQNGGEFDARTRDHETLYRIIVPVDKIDDVLDWFMDLIINPRFNKKEVNDELNSMNSEFWWQWTFQEARYLGLLHHFGSKGHPFSSYGMGNLSTLQNPSIYLPEYTQNWWQRKYVSKNMAVGIQGPKPVAELAAIVCKYFGRIPASPRNPRCELLQKFPPESFPPFVRQKWNRCYHVIPSCEDRNIRLTWWLPERFGADFETKPLDFLAYLLKIQSSGGLLYYLREKGWLLYSEMKCKGCSHMTTKFCTLFVIKLHLTVSGFGHRQDVIRSVFHYLFMLRHSQPADLERIFNEVKQFHADAFHFRSDDNITNPGDFEGFNFNFHPHNGNFTLAQLATFLIDNEDPTELLTSRMLIKKWDEKLVKEALDFLVDPANVNCVLGSKDFPPGEQDHVWHDLRFSVHNSDYIDEKGLYGKNLDWIQEHELHRVIGSKIFYLPPPNQYIHRSQCFPIPLEDRTVQRPFSIPKERFGNKCSLEYYNGDCSPGLIPTAEYIFTLETSVTSERFNLEVMPKLTLFGDCLKQVVECRIASALSSLVTFDVSFDDTEFTVVLRGPAVLMPQLTKEVFHVLKGIDDPNSEMKLTEQMYRTVLEDLVKEKEIFIENSENFAEHLLQMTTENYFTMVAEYQNAFKFPDYRNFISFISRIKEKMFISIHLDGCVSKTNIKEIIALVRALPYDPLLQEAFPETFNQTLKLPVGERCFQVLSRNLVESHIWVRNHYQIDFDDRTTARMVDAVYGYLNTMAYFELRIKQQIGYHAFIAIDPLGISVVVCGLLNRYDASYIDEQIDKFLKDFYKKIILPRKNYRRHIEPYIAEGEVYIRPKDIQIFYKDHLLPEGQQRRKLSVQVIGQEAVRNVEDLRKGKEVEKKIKKYASNIQISNWTHPEYKLKNDLTNEENGYFITDIGKFKMSLDRF